MKRTVFCALALLITPVFAHAQEYLLQLPRSSPRAEVMQTIGITEITLDYGRPGVKGRKIWGSMVPYDRIWRAGADENTTISFSTAVTVGGVDLPAGTYGVHMIPGSVYWTIILSFQAHAWGSYGYDPAEDAVRLTVRPTEGPHRERLMYFFTDIASNSCRVAMEWEKLRVSFEVQVNVNETVVAELRDALRGRAGRWWHGWHTAAEWCWAHNTNLDEALGWIERSINMDRNFFNLRTKALILEKLDYTDRARAVMDEAFSIASEDQVFQYAEILMADGDTDRAISVLKENARNHPDSWRAYTKLADAYLNKDEKKRALELYEQAYEKADDPRVKQLIQAIMDEVRSR